MNKNVNKALVNVNENSIFYKIKLFFQSFLHKNKVKQNNTIEEDVVINKIPKDQNTKTKFLNEIQNIENEETKLLKLQQQYENGQINEETLSSKQIADLEKLYNKQNNDLLKNNINRIGKRKENPNVTEFIKEIRNIENGETKLLKLQQQFENNEISEEQLTDEQKEQLLELYEDQNYWLEKSNALRKEKLLQYKKKMAV